MKGANQNKFFGVEQWNGTQMARICLIYAEKIKESVEIRFIRELRVPLHTDIQEPKTKERNGTGT